MTGQCFLKKIISVATKMLEEQRTENENKVSGFLMLNDEDKQCLTGGVAQLLSKCPPHITKYTLQGGYKYVVESRRLGIVTSGSTLGEAKAAFLSRLKQTEE